MQWRLNEPLLKTGVKFIAARSIPTKRISIKLVDNMCVRYMQWIESETF